MSVLDDVRITLDMCGRPPMEEEIFSLARRVAGC